MIEGKSSTISTELLKQLESKDSVLVLEPFVTNG